MNMRFLRQSSFGEAVIVKAHCQQSTYIWNEALLVVIPQINKSTQLYNEIKLQMQSLHPEDDIINGSAG